MSRKRREKQEEIEKQEELKQKELKEAKEIEKESEKKPEKRPIAWVYVGDKNRLDIDLGKGKGSIILWRNTVYRKLPECKAIEELKEKGLLKPIYG